jgi:ComF family protein
MARSGGPQYIEVMLSAAFAGASRARPAHPSLLHRVLPSQCLLCHQWQRGTLCQHCALQWRPAVRRCMRCAIDLAAGYAGDVCVLCEDQSPEFDRAIAAVDYIAPWVALLGRLKFHGGTALAKPLGRMLAQAVSHRRGRVSLVLPVPLSPQRQLERGYNQSWLLAQHTSAQLGLPARQDLLLRSRHTPRLMTLTAEERHQHIRGAFAVPRLAGPALRGRDVALVDDVMTTGATLNAASAALLDGGARSVSVWVLARTPAPDPSTSSQMPN